MNELIEKTNKYEKTEFHQYFVKYTFDKLELLKRLDRT